MPEYLPITHARFVKVQRDIFTSHLSPNCMSHQCKLRTEGDRLKLDACCQYGADVDIGERDKILGHAPQLRTILSEEVRDLPWFKEEVTKDVDFPSGAFVRTQTFGDGCIFLQHDARGCAIHRASVEAGWDFHGIKPNICRLFPMSYDDEAIVMSDDYADYSCAYEPGTPTVYRVGRPDLEAIFGEELVLELDRIESAVLAEAPKKLDVVD